MHSPGRITFIQPAQFTVFEYVRRHFQHPISQNIDINTYHHFFAKFFPVQITIKWIQCGRATLNYYLRRECSHSRWKKLTCWRHNYFNCITIHHEIFILQKCTNSPERRKKSKNLPDTYINIIYVRIHRTAIEHSVCAKNCLPSSQRYDDQIELNDKLKGTHHDSGRSSATTKTRVYNEIKCE